MPLRLAVLTISDACSGGERSDSSGDLIASWGKGRGYTLTERDVAPEATRAVLLKEASGIAEALRMSVFRRFPRAACATGSAC